MKLEQKIIYLRYVYTVSKQYSSLIIISSLNSLRNKYEYSRYSRANQIKKYFRWVLDAKPPLNLSLF